MRHQLMQRLRGTAQLTCILGNAADPAWILLAHGVDGFHAAGDVLGGGGLLIQHQGDFLCGAGGIRLAHACMDAGDGLQGVVSALTHFARGAANIASAVRGALSQFALLEVHK